MGTPIFIFSIQRLPSNQKNFFFFFFVCFCLWGLTCFSVVSFVYVLLLPEPPAQSKALQCGFRATSVTYTTAHGNAGFPTH